MVHMSSIYYAIQGSLYISALGGMMFDFTRSSVPSPSPGPLPYSPSMTTLEIEFSHNIEYLGFSAFQHFADRAEFPNPVAHRCASYRFAGSKSHSTSESLTLKLFNHQKPESGSFFLLSRTRWGHLL